MCNSHNTCKSQYIKIFVYYIRHGFHYLHFDVRAKKRFQLLKNKIRFLSNVKVITFQGFDDTKTALYFKGKCICIHNDSLEAWIKIWPKGYLIKILPITLHAIVFRPKKAILGCKFCIWLCFTNHGTKIYWWTEDDWFTNMKTISHFNIYAQHGKKVGYLSEFLD